jgi:Leucine-rich repeat (LRR) protein
MLKSGGLALAAQHFGCGQSRVEEINLSSNGFLDMDAQAACGALQGNLVLRVLDLSKNQFGDIAAKHFGALLAENATLEELNLSGNCIRQRGAKMIASGIAANVALVRLNLNDNGLGTAGMTAIAEALSSNSTLTQLDVAGNNISNAAAIALGAALRSHKALVKVDVSSNPITGSGMRALFEALGARGTPVEITFNGITLDNESIAAMEQASKLNPDTRFYGDFPTFEGFDSVREQAMQASDRMSKHGPDWKPRVSIPINTQVSRPSCRLHCTIHLVGSHVLQPVGRRVVRFITTTHIAPPSSFFSNRMLAATLVKSPPLWKMGQTKDHLACLNIFPEAQKATCGTVWMEKI